MNTDFLFLGVDGGGSGTRVVLADSQGRCLSQAESGPSGLGLGIEPAWQAIKAGCTEAFAAVGGMPEWPRCVLGCGLAGANNPEWLAQFRQHAPNLAGLVVESDAYTTLLGAHGGAPGVIVALGTGSIAAAGQVGMCRIVGGYGFPSGDEASGAWLGLRAIAHAQQALDGRVPNDAFARALLAQTGAHDRDSLIVWLCSASQTAYARLAPTVIAHRSHPHAGWLLHEAGVEIARMIAALDSALEQPALPVALCGGLATALHEFVPSPYRERLREPLGDSVRGALQLAQHEAVRLARTENQPRSQQR
ncbi:BadF/BadG/BcrA/BcrD ATPase family protein [Paraburkholderia hayleyella]|uniref:BadF/BadG/BcrA/BcrD ATPase family protein n=1 Tax=Paraburkholderia hayleyella TaxID=2152889 RepID=UPI0012921378|nr:BadF/BadG/BcrA/BcrD ATPase family protein [Paraburkholderia hayleyella]